MWGPAAPLNLESGESRTLLTMENIIHYWVMDSKAFIITETEAGYRFWMADLQDGKPVELVGATDEHGIAMSPFQEGGSFFRGVGRQWPMRHLQRRFLRRTL